MNIREYEPMRVKTVETAEIIEHIENFSSLVQDLESCGSWFRRGCNKPFLLIGVDNETGLANVDIYSEVYIADFMKNIDNVVKKLHAEYESAKSLSADLENKMNQLLNNSTADS